MISKQALSPKIVHELSEKVYASDRFYRDLRNRNPKQSEPKIIQQAQARMQFALENGNIGLHTQQFLTATSGIFQINQLTGFGFVAEGQGSRKGELVLATRGTNFESNKFDLATDANIGYGIGPGGHVVHRGFLRTFKGYQTQLVQMLNSVKSQGVTTVHCLGHSLGGALANLNAALLHHAGFNVHLYTIGAPRVGLPPFAGSITGNISQDQIFRVSNPNDPVPMLPLFPFVHASRSVSEYQVCKGDRIAIGQHLLSDGYTPMSRCSAWSDLNLATAHDLSQASTLNNQLSRIGGGVAFSTKALDAITKALLNLAKQVGMATMALFQTPMSVGFTVFDLMAELLTKAIALGSKLKDHAVGIVHAMLRFMGRAATQAQNVTINMLRWVLNTFVTELGNRALQAIQRAISGSNRLR